MSAINDLKPSPIVVQSNIPPVVMEHPFIVIVELLIISVGVIVNDSLPLETFILPGVIVVFPIVISLVVRTVVSSPNNSCLIFSIWLFNTVCNDMTLFIFSLRYFILIILLKNKSRCFSLIICVAV